MKTRPASGTGTPLGARLFDFFVHIGFVINLIISALIVGYWFLHR